MRVSIFTKSTFLKTTAKTDVAKFDKRDFAKNEGLVPHKINLFEKKCEEHM
jgi:hypothetical protein